MRISIACVAAVALSVAAITASAADFALYNGSPNPGWYSVGDVPKDVETIAGDVDGLNSVETFTDDEIEDLAAWAEANMDDGELDIMWLPGVMPSTLYPNPNLEPDGSIAERWLEGGNMFINVADWFAYTTYEGGARGADNAAGGAENIMNLPGIIRFGDNTVINMTADGEKYLPSIGGTMTTDRPIVQGAVKPPWEAAVIFGEAGTDMEPVLLHNIETDGYVAIINQGTTGHAVDRAAATVDFINIWVAEQGFLSVEPAGKLTTTWGMLKR